MEQAFRMADLSAGACDCCVTSSESIPPDYGCTERKTVFTAREQKVLKLIRDAGERARFLKTELRRSDGVELTKEHRGRMEQELEHLRGLRWKLEAERVAAAEERMRYLGHA